MLFVNFIHPLIDNLRYVRANHDVAGFVLGKKCYPELAKFHNGIKGKKNFFNNQSMLWPRLALIDILWMLFEKVGMLLLIN